MKQTITPDKQTVQEALQGRTYFVDFYQREYVWSKETVDILLRDIFYSFDISYDQFKNAELTAEVMEKFNWYYLNIFITNNINGKAYIVDGQQRLSTLTLLAAKLYHLTDNEILKDILKACIFSNDAYKGNKFNIDNEKRHDVMKAVLDNKEYTIKFKNKTEETIITRYADISKFIDEKEMDKNRLTAFIHYFLERLVLVELTIEKDDTPMIFEVINDRGEALKPFEILKGKLIGALAKEDTYAFSEKWDSAMDRLFGLQDEFFVDYIRSRFIFKKNTKIETAVNQVYHRYIFENNEIAAALSFRKQDECQIDHIKKFINNDLKYYSRLYATVCRNPNNWLVYLNAINTFQSQYHIILAACDIDDAMEMKKIEVISKEFDRFYVLLRLNSIYDSNSFQEAAYWFNFAIKGKPVEEYRQIFDGKILEILREKKGKNATSVLEYNAFLKANYTNLDTRFLRYFLARVEKYITTQCNCEMQNDVQYISTRTGHKTGYHIEHILSRNETNLGYFENEEAFENHRNQLGGLLLLKGLDNISSSNEEYADKLKTYSVGLMWGHTLCTDFYHTNKDFDAFNNTLHENYGIMIKPYQKFDAQALEDRNKLLYNLVKIIWEID